jgi:hypothetical protein
MGLLSRIKDKVKAGLGGPETKPQARPAPATQPGPSRDEAARVAAEAADKARKKNAGEDKPWYLDGANDGWDDTNVQPDPKPKT